MSPFLILTGLLVIAAGLVSLRTSARMHVSVPVGALAQVLMGAVVCFMGFSSSMTGGAGLVAAVASILLVLASAVWQGLRLRAARRKREESEGARLVTYVKYLSRDITPRSNPHD